MAKKKSKELEKLGKKIERLTKDFNNKKITNMSYLLQQQIIYNRIKDFHWKELGFQEKILISTALKTCKMGLALERRKPKSRV